MIPESFIERLKDESDIERVISSYLPLKRHGRLLKGLCPFHSEKTPSFTVYSDTQSYFCFGCQKGGDVVTFIREIEHLEYLEAIKLLAQKAGMTVPDDGADDGTARLKARILEINRTSARFFHSCLTGQGGAPARQYLASRGLSKKTVRSFGVGYCPDTWDALVRHLGEQGFSQQELLAAGVASRGKQGRLYDQFRGRVIFPILDLRGNVIGFGGRALGDARGPKYLNTGDTPVFKKNRNLYALNFAKSSGSDKLLLAEGYMDVIALHQAGFTNAVATLGTALTPEQARLISRYADSVAIAYDSDGAGQNAARRAINLFSQLEVSVSVLDIKGAKDPDEYIQKFGAHRFQNLIDGGKSALSFEIEKLRSGFDLDSLEGKTAFLRDFCRLMAGISSDLQREVYISEIAGELGVDSRRLAATADDIRKKRLSGEKKKQAHNLRAYVQDNPAGGSLQAPRADLGALVAERGVISMLLHSPDYYGEIQSKLTDEDFASPDHAAIFHAMCALLAQNKAPELFHFGPYLSTHQMGLLSGIIAASAQTPRERGQLAEYIAAIKRQKQKSPDELGAMTPQELQEYITSRRATKK